MGERLQRQSPGSKWPEIPAKAPFLASTGERVVCGDWMVEMVWFELAAPHTVLSNRVSNRTRLVGESRYAHGNHAVAA